MRVKIGVLMLLAQAGLTGCGGGVAGSKGAAQGGAEAVLVAVESQPGTARR